MLCEGIEIKAVCRACETAFKVDLEMLVDWKGEDFSLIGLHPPCRIFECAGRCIFLVSPARGTPMITLDRWAPEG